MANKCGTCGKGFANNAYRLECGVCHVCFHLDCLNISKEVYLSYKNNFKCDTCSVKRRRPDADKTVGGGQPNGGDSDSGDSASTSGDGKVKRRRQISADPILEAINAFRDDMNVKITEQNKEIADLKTHLNKYSELISLNTTALANLEAKFSSLTSMNEALESRCVMLERKVADLEEVIADSEQNALSNCMEISGIPETRNENVFELVQRIGEVLKLRLRDDMINNCYRRKAPSNSSNNNSIFVSFVRKLDKNDFMMASRQRKQLVTSRDIGFLDGEASKIYINHSLSFKKRQILRAAKSSKLNNGFKYVWVRNGNILMKKEEGADTFTIKSLNDLRNLSSGQQTPNVMSGTKNGMSSQASLQT